MAKSDFEAITRRHSTTFYYAARFFPRHTRGDVYRLYAFLRTADDLVDEAHDARGLMKFKQHVMNALSDQTEDADDIVGAFADLAARYRFERHYVDSFFRSLETDLVSPLVMPTWNDLQTYVYGVAGVVGLMMAKIMALPQALLPAAQSFGELMQIVNILRDVKEDYHKQRVYIPQEDLNRFGLTDIAHEGYLGSLAFKQLMRFEVTRVLERLDQLAGDIGKIPQEYRRPITISGAVYRLIAQKIYERPEMVWKTRVRVSRLELLGIIWRNLR